MLNTEELKNAMGELDEDIVTELLKAVMDDGGSEAQAAMEACQEGMNIVGDLFEKGEYFVGDLIYAGELMQQAVNILKPALAEGGGRLPGDRPGDRRAGGKDCRYGKGKESENRRPERRADAGHRFHESYGGGAESGRAG